MKTLRVIYYRGFQKALHVLSSALPSRGPELLQGQGAYEGLPNYIIKQGLKNVLVVTDKGLMKAGLLNSLLKGLEEEQIRYVLFDEVIPNPTIDNIEACVSLYHKNNCQGIIAVGGGSPMDCAKGTAARIGRPDKTIAQMKGLLKVKAKVPPLFAVPTTAGTGSETTVAAVITDSATHHKYAINDPVLVPYAAVLDPNLTLKLNPFITATTGMDALCHAVEAYIGKAGTSITDECAIKAVKLIFDNLFIAYEQGNDITARTNMQQAAYLAGIAFTKAYVGWVHAIAHTLGGFYQTPHGLANAVIMPYVFRAYGASAHGKLAQLADVVGIEGITKEDKAEKFIKAIEKLNKKMNIPNHIIEIKEEDIEKMATYAAKEANPLYPTPRIIFKEEAKKLYLQIRG